MRSRFTRMESRNKFNLRVRGKYTGVSSGNLSEMESLILQKSRKTDFALTMAEVTSEYNNNVLNANQNGCPPVEGKAIYITRQAPLASPASSTAYTVDLGTAAELKRRSMDETGRYFADIERCRMEDLIDNTCHCVMGRTLDRELIELEKVIVSLETMEKEMREDPGGSPHSALEEEKQEETQTALNMEEEFEKYHFNTCIIEVNNQGAVTACRSETDSHQLTIDANCVPKETGLKILELGDKCSVCNDGGRDQLEVDIESIMPCLDEFHDEVLQFRSFLDQTVHPNSKVMDSETDPDELQQCMEEFYKVYNDVPIEQSKVGNGNNSFQVNCCKIHSPSSQDILQLCLINSTSDSSLSSPRSEGNQKRSLSKSSHSRKAPETSDLATFKDDNTELSSQDLTWGGTLIKSYLNSVSYGDLHSSMEITFDSDSDRVPPSDGSSQTDVETPDGPDRDSEISECSSFTSSEDDKSDVMTFDEKDPSQPSPSVDPYLFRIREVCPESVEVIPYTDIEKGEALDGYTYAYSDTSDDPQGSVRLGESMPSQNSVPRESDVFVDEYKVYAKSEVVGMDIDGVSDNRGRAEDDLGSYEHEGNKEEGVYLPEAEDHLEAGSKAGLHAKPGGDLIEDDEPHLSGIPEREEDEANESKITDDQSDTEAFDEETNNQEGGRQESESTMGKSSRVPSPKKLVVDEVLPPGHPMPPPRGSLRYHHNGGTAKSGIPKPGGIPRRTPTPLLEGRMSPRQSTPTPSAWCDNCRSLLVDLKRQALRIYKAHIKNGESLGNNSTHKEVDVIGKIEEKLHLPDGNYNRSAAPWCDTCEICQTQLSRLKQEALNMVQSLDRTQADSPIPPPSSAIPTISHPPGTKNGVAIMPRTTPHYSSAHHRLVRQGVYGSSRGHGGATSPPVGDHHKQYGWASAKHKHINQMLANQGQLMNGVRVNNHGDLNGAVRASNNDPYNGGPHSPNMNGGVAPLNRPMMLPLHQPHYVSPVVAHEQRQCLSPASTTSNGSGTSAAASFFARAAQKLNISSRKKRKHHGPDTHEQPFPTNFCEIIYNNPPPAPPVLLRSVGRPTNPGTGKVKVMLRICPVEGNNTGSFLSLDARKKQVTVYDPSINGYTTAAHRQRGVVAAPKMFAFDTIFSEDDSLSEMCATGLTDIIQAVVNGADGCLFCYGHARLGKTYTMIGVDDHPQNLGLIPCAIAWLFKLINEQKEKTGARFSVRVSAVEVTGKNEQLKDLLLDVAHGMEAGSGTAPGVYLREDPISGTQLENQSELRAPTGDRAAHYLDAAVAARTVPEVEEDARNSHMLFTLHVYQYRVEKGGRGSNGVAGGRSRLHLVDLGSCGKSKDGSQALSLSALGNVILALLNGQRHVPHRESKLTQLMKDSLGNLSCRTCMIAHVSPAVQAYNETLQVIQLAARIHRMKRRRTNKFSSTSSESGSSCDESGHMRRRMRVGIRMGTLREDAMSMSDPDYTSSSEQSCDTVIYCGPNGQPLSDRELTDNEGPPRMVPIRPRMGRSSHLRSSGSRSSGDESSSSISDFRLGKPPVPKCGTIANSRLPMKAGRSPPVMPGSPSRSLMGSPVPGVVQLPRKINIKGKQQCVNGHDPSLRTTWSKGPYREQNSGSGPEQWIDGPGMSQQNQSEQWIDGPDASSMVYQPPPLQPMSQGELWIDGPVLRPPGSQWIDQQKVYQQEHMQQQQIVLQQQQQQHHHQHQHHHQQQQQHVYQQPMSSPRPGEHEHRVERISIKKQAAQPKAIPASEQWVDGPAEFLVESQAVKSDRPTKMWTEMGGSSAPSSPKIKPAPPPRTQSLKPEEQTQKSDEPVVAGIQPAVESEPNHNEVTKPCLPLRNPILAQIAVEGGRPTSQISTDSGTSLAAQVSETDSRPVSMAGIEVNNTEMVKPVTNVPTATESHQLPGAPVKSFVRDWVEKHSVIQEEESNHRQNTDSHSQRSKDPASLDELLFGKNAVPLETSSQTNSARSSPRIKKRLRKGTLPPPIDHPMNRTAAWIVSVQNAGTETEDMVVSPPDETLQDPLLAPECDQDLMRVGPPPTYEDCMEVERQGDDEDGEELEVVDQECQVSIHTAENEEEEAAQGGIVCHLNAELYSEKDTASVDNGAENGIDISNLLISNRESIYELQMDETLECSRGADGSWPNTFTSEDDMSSSASLPRKNEDVCEIYEVMHEVENVEIPSPSHYDEGVVGDLLVNMEKKHALVTAGTLPQEPHMSPLSVNADNESGIASSSGEHPSPPSSSSDSDKHSTGNKPATRPTCLRRPDGASNPELNLVEKARDLVLDGEITEKVISSPEPLALPILPESSPSCTSKSTVSDEAEQQSAERTEGEGQGESPVESSEDISLQKDTSETELKQAPESVGESGIPPPKVGKKIPVKSGLKPPVPVRTSSRPSILPKPSATSSKASASSAPGASTQPSSPSSIQSPRAGSSLSLAKSLKTETSPTKSTKADSSPTKSTKAETSPTKGPKTETSSTQGAKAESKTTKPEKSFSSRSPFRFGSKSKIASPKTSASKPPKSGNTSPSKPLASSTLQSKASKEKSNKLSQKSASASGVALPRTASAKSVPSSVQSMTSRLTSSLSRLPTSSKNKDKTSPTKNLKSKIPSPGKKESKLPVSKVSNSRVSELNGVANGRATDSDSGNDSGIVKNEKKKKLLSPYSTMTQPRNSTHSSSGHGSDNSSTFSGHLVPSIPNIKGGETHHSSGYESMLRDSEATASSSTQDSTSEGSCSGRTRGPKIFKKKSTAGTRRSRSAPPRACEEPESPSRHQSPSTPVRQPLPGSPARAWIDTRQIPNTNSEPIEITVYDVHDVERMQRRRKEDAEMRALEKRRARIRELVAKQQHLKKELAEAKDMLMIDRNTWSYDLYVAEQMDRDDPNYLEALEKETSILEKRVEACKSRIMMVTCFDMGV